VQRGTHEELMLQTTGPYLRVANLQLVDSHDLQLLGLASQEGPS
jgi:hypothetical protein